MRRIILLLAIAVTHVIVTIVCGTAEFSTGRFIFSPPSPAHGFWSVALKVVEFPLLSVVRVLDSKNLPFYPYIMVLNSLLWATAVVLGIRAIRKRFVAASILGF